MNEADRRRLRAARTFALLAALGSERELETGEALRGQLWADWTTDDLGLEQALLDTVTDADLRLAEALMEVGREHRGHEWDALERLLGVAAGEGDLDERFRALEGRDLATAGTAVLDLGWGGSGLYAVPSPAERAVDTPYAEAQPYPQAAALRRSIEREEAESASAREAELEGLTWRPFRTFWTALRRRWRS